MKKNSKKLTALFLVFALALSLFTPVMAAETRDQEIVDLGDGFYAVIILNKTPSSRAGDTVKGSKTGTVYHNGTAIGTAAFAATFDISGATAKVVSTSINGRGTNGWSYSHGTTGRSGNKATGTAYFTDGSIIRSLTLTLTCSPTGVIS